MILLDTCALLWLAHERENISPATLARIDADSSVSISSVTGFEIGLKYRSGRLVLPVPPEQWLDGILEHHGIDVIDLDLAICLKAASLPPIHKDPCDRFIIATALIRELAVVTTDARFAGYGITVLA